MNDRPTRQPPDADDFDAALRARSRLLPRFEESTDEEPSPELDRIVLARARDALRREIPAERHYRGPRWAVPVALAATVLLSLGLVMQMDPTREDLVLQQPASTTQAMDESNAEYRASTESELAPAPPSAAVAANAPTPAPGMPPAPASSAVAFSAQAPAPAVMAAVGEARAKASAAMPFATAAGAALSRDDPQRWLEDIERLRRTGEIDAARRELADFVDQHPDLPLPAALQLLR